MKHSMIAVLVVCVAGVNGCTDVVGEAPTIHARQRYGQTVPGKSPELFAPGVLSTGANELNCAISPDGSQLVFSEWNQGVNTLMVLDRQGDTWGGRRVLPFSGQASDVDPVFSADGARLYFSSKRPSGPGDDVSDSNLWVVDRLRDGSWGEPRMLHGPNTPHMDEYYTSIAADGTLYFSVFSEHGSPGDLFNAAPAEGGFAAPVRLGEPISTEHNEHDPCVAADGSYLIFTSDRPTGMGRGDLWISFRSEHDGWSQPLNMGPQINTDAYEYCPMLSPDGKHLFLTRNAGGNGDIYWVDAGVIEMLRD